MEWIAVVEVITLLQCIACPSFSSSQTYDIASNSFPLNLKYSEEPWLNKRFANKDRKRSTNVETLENVLLNILLHPEKGIPIISIEDNFSGEMNQLEDTSMNDDKNIGFDHNAFIKRSRYYRKYPWKRQNSKEMYDAENRYLCQPSREDVFRLLVALHDSLTGNRGQTVNFCNRRRSASSVMTNIRFVGK